MLSNGTVFERVTKIICTFVVIAVKLEFRWDWYRLLTFCIVQCKCAADKGVFKEAVTVAVNWDEMP